MKKRHIFFALLGLLVGWGMAGVAQAASPAVTSQVTDNPGDWFRCANTGSTASGIGCVLAALAGTGEKSIAVIRPGEQIAFASTG